MWDHISEVGFGFVGYVQLQKFFANTGVKGQNFCPQLIKQDSGITTGKVLMVVNAVSLSFLSGRTVCIKYILIKRWEIPYVDGL